MRIRIEKTRTAALAALPAAAVIIAVALWSGRGCAAQNSPAAADAYYQNAGAESARREKSRDCLELAEALLNSGEWETGRSIFLLCGEKDRARRGRIEDMLALREEFARLMSGWSAPWPDFDGEPVSTMSRKEAETRAASVAAFAQARAGDETGELAAIAAAALLYHAGRYDDCARLLAETRVSRAMPDHAALLAVMALVKFGKHEEAAELADRAKKDFPVGSAAPYLSLWKSRALAAQGRLQSAVAVALETAYDASLAPRARGDALFLASQHYLAAGEKKTAASLIASIAENHPAIDSARTLDVDLTGLENFLSLEQRIALGAYFVSKQRGFAARKFLSPVKNNLGPEGLLLLAKANILSGAEGDALKQLEQLNAGNVPASVRGEACLARARMLMTKKTYPQAETRLLGCVANYENVEIESLAALARVYAATEKEEKRIRTLMRLMEKSPSAESGDERYLLIARWHLTKGDYAAAAKYYAALDRWFPNSPLRAEGGFWQAKLALASGDARAATAHYKRVQAEHPYSYFSHRAGTRLSGPLGLADDSDSAPEMTFGDLTPADCDILRAANGFRRLRAFERAADEYSAAAVRFPNDAAAGLARLRLDEKKYHLSVKAVELRVMADPAFYHRVMTDPELASLLYPRLYEDRINATAAAAGIDPAWIFSIIRQESRFQRDAVSTSNAIGLMQIIPSTGSWIAEKLGVSKFRSDDLFDIDVNLRFGAWYFKYLLGKFDGNPELAVAAYNGGPGNVSRWLPRLGSDDIDLFIERIPRDETREYVKKVMHNHHVYSRLCSARAPE
jgi:soluble lytic murein transglycosylase